MAKKSSLSNFQIDLVKGLIPEGNSVAPARHKISMTMADPYSIPDPADGQVQSPAPTLAKSIINLMDGPKGSLERLAFETDPTLNNAYAGLYKQKVRLIPDVILKRIMIQDNLVASIVNTRGNHIASFGRPRPSRHEKGFVIEPKPGVLDKMSDDQKEILGKRIDVVENRLMTCGNTKGWDDEDRMTFSSYLFQSTKNAVGLGRIATEIIWAYEGGQKKFHSFRPIDAGTIYKAAPQNKEAADSVRKQAKALLEQVRHKRLVAEPKNSVDHYPWIQVINGVAEQAFASDECVVHNFYPVADIEMDGYPVTPLDTVIGAVTCHINIAAHNKLYFQSGRASRGMLIIKSDDVDEQTINKVKQQFNATINGVGNSWRMPVFGVGAEDDISWQPIDSGSRDMEFQYLSDTNAREILSAFQMSPEELPGWAHLSKGTASQSLSESNTEYILEAHRDVGLRPLMEQWNDIVNAYLFPLFDPDLAKICTFKFVGLDAETAEKESIRLAQDLPLHMTMDDVLDKVEKEPIGKEFGGDFLINPQWQQLIAPYLTVGEILEKFFGRANASKDPILAYRRDPFWFQQQQLIQGQQQAQQQMQQQQQAQGSPNQTPQSTPGPGQQQSPEVDQAIDGAQQALGKSEAQLSESGKKLLIHQENVVDRFKEMWIKESAAALKEIARAALNDE